MGLKRWEEGDHFEMREMEWQRCEEEEKCKRSGGRGDPRGRKIHCYCQVCSHLNRIDSRLEVQ